MRGLRDFTDNLILRSFEANAPMCEIKYADYHLWNDHFATVLNRQQNTMYGIGVITVHVSLEWGWGCSVGDGRVWGCVRSVLSVSCTVSVAGFDSTDSSFGNGKGNNAYWRGGGCSTLSLNFHELAQVLLLHSMD